MDWRRSYPPGLLDQLAEQYWQAETARVTAEGAERDANGIAASLAREDKELRREIPALSRVTREAEKKAAKLRALADEHAKVIGWQEDIRAAREDRTQAEQLAERKRAEGAELGRQQLDAYREADSQRRTAEARRQELGGVIGGGAVDESMPVPEAGLESLRAAYQSAVAAYEKVAVGATLLAEVDRLERAEAQARSEREGIDPAVRDRASALLLTPEGSDVSARTEATERTARGADALDQRVIGAPKLEGELKHAFEEYIQQERSLEPYGKPESISHGEQLIERATTYWDKARGDLEHVRVRMEEPNEQLTATKDLVRDFAAVRESLAVMVSSVTEGGASPFEGTVDGAQSRRDTVRDTFQEASGLLSEATDQVRRAADALARHAANERFEKLAAPVRRQLNATERDRLTDFAAEWEADFAAEVPGPER